jgi:hypothetical protein
VLLTWVIHSALPTSLPPHHPVSVTSRRKAEALAAAERELDALVAHDEIACVPARSVMSVREMRKWEARARVCVCVCVCVWVGE